MNGAEWRIVEGSNAAGSVADHLHAPNRGDAVGVFYDRELAHEVARMLNLSDLVDRCMTEARASEGADDAGAQQEVW